MATKPEIERLSVLETKVDRAVEDISDIKDTVTTEFNALNKKIDGLDKKFAAKWVQNAVGFVIALIVGAVIMALVALVVIPSTKEASQGSSGASTSTTTTTTTPTGSTSTTRNSGTPGATATANSKSDSATPSSSDTQTSPGASLTLPKAP